MIIYDNVIPENEAVEITVSLAELGLDVETPITYDGEDVGIGIFFKEKATINELLKDAIETFTEYIGYYDNGKNDIGYKTNIHFVYFFDADKLQVAIHIEPINKADTAFLKPITLALLNVELDDNDRKYLCKSLAEMLYNV